MLLIMQYKKIQLPVFL